MFEAKTPTESEYWRNNFPGFSGKAPPEDFPPLRSPIDRPPESALIQKLNVLTIQHKVEHSTLKIECPLNSQS